MKKTNGVIHPAAGINMPASTQLLKSFSLMMAACSLAALSSCSTIDSGKEHTISKSIPSSLFQKSKYVLKAQPNGYASMETTYTRHWDGRCQDILVKVYLDKNNLHQIQQILDNFQSWEAIARKSGINTEKNVFHVNSEGRHLSILFRARSGHAWIDMQIADDFTLPCIQIKPDQISEAKRLISHTLQEMNSLQQVERQLKQLQ